VKVVMIHDTASYDKTPTYQILQVYIKE